MFPNYLYIIYVYTYIYACVYFCVRKLHGHLCSGPNLDLQVILDALNPQVSECLENTDKDLELCLFVCLRNEKPSCFEGCSGFPRNLVLSHVIHMSQSLKWKAFLLSLYRRKDNAAEIYVQAYVCVCVQINIVFYT